MNVDKIIKKKQHIKRNGDLRQLAEITKTIGDIYFENGQVQEALQEYFEQLSICEDLQDKLNCAIAHRMIGEIYANLGNYEQALVHQNLHLEGARDMKNLIEEQRAFATLGRTHFCLAESLLSQSQKRDEALADAKTAYVKSMELCDSLTESEIKFEEKTLMRARLLLNLGLTLEAQKETQQAISLIEQATSLCMSNNFQEDLHRTYISLGTIYERQDNFELALNYIEAAGAVNNKSLKTEAEILKAELFMRTGQWIKARKILVSLYTTNTLSRDINYQVEKYLRIIVTLCRAENNLLIETDIQSKQKLYENLGDAAIAAQCFDKAVEYYRQMLTCAEKTGNHINIALSSLSQTLKDVGQYKEALYFAQRELKLCTNSDEKSKSALFLAELLIATNAVNTEIKEYYTLALMSANKSNNLKLQKFVTKEFVNYLESISEFDEAKDIKKKTKLEALSDTESEASLSEESDKIGADICLEDLSDLEVEENVKKITTTKRKGNKTPAIKRNEKGETQLHVACINGDINTVERLLLSGHSTNVRDHYGWSPLHEAANHGHTEIAELLLKHNANINDPGGVSCKGMTPLHDAACCGHFPMMQFLMQHGANLTLKTHDGDTVLDCLEDWRERVEDLRPEDLAEYEIIHKKLSTIISTRKNRKKSITCQMLSEESMQPKIRKISAGEDYRRTIENLKSFNKINSVAAFTKSNDTAMPLVNEGEVLVDDWLEDDIGCTITKKPVSNHCVTGKRKYTDINIESSTMKKSKRNETFKSKENANENRSTIEESLSSEESLPSSEEFTISHAACPVVHSQSPLFTSTSSKHTQYSKECINLSISVNEKIFSVKIDVCDDEKEFLTRITTTLEQMFLNETGCNAKLQLQPINGNLIKENIKVTKANNIYTKDKLECKIVELQIPSIVERYTIICSTHNTTPCNIILKCLKSCENTSTFRVKPDDVNQELLTPLLKSLVYEKNIKLLQLSGIMLLTERLYLRECLSNLSSLQELYLKGCDIDYTFLREITSLPPQLRVLDLSYNPLSSKSCETLQKLIVPLRHLQTLNLCYCQLEDFSLPFKNPNLTRCDISWNKLNRDTMITFLSGQFNDLKLSNTFSFHFNQCSLNLNTNIILSPSLESLELSFCDITDSDVKIILAQLPRLLKLILSRNKKVSESSVNILLSRHPTLTYIDVSGCNNIVNRPEIGLTIQNPEVCTLLVNIESDLCNAWVKLWRGLGTVTKLPYNLAIFKPM